MGFKSTIFILLILFINPAVLAKSFVFNHLQISGNQRTKQEVFLREMGYQFGDQIPEIDSMLGLWQKRFSGLGLFNYVSVNVNNDTLKISVSERFYTWAKPLLQWGDRNFNVWWQTRDYERLVYGGTVYFNNLRGLNEQFYFTAIGGYNQHVEVGYSTPFKGYNSGWAFATKGYWWTNHELWYKAHHDELIFISSFGQQMQDNKGVELTEKRRFNYFARTEISQGWNRIKIDSSINKGLENFLFDGHIQNEYYVKAEFIYDRRDQRDYPSNGILLKWGIKTAQYNTFKSERTVGSSWLRLSLFKPLSKKLGTVLALNTTGNVMSRKLPYRLSRQLGYQSDYVRGYEPYVGDGQGFVLGKIAIRQALVNQKTLNLSLPDIINNYGKIPISLWFNIFADAGKVLHPYDGVLNPLSNDWYRGYGVGLDIIAWYSAMMRMEYSINHLGKAYFNVSFKNAF